MVTDATYQASGAAPSSITSRLLEKLSDCGNIKIDEWTIKRVAGTAYAGK